MSDSEAVDDDQASTEVESSSTGTSATTSLPNWLAIVLVTGTSAAVLVLEILAGRLLAPYVGVSLETFTGIIGVILAGIAVGAWAGGALADRVNPRGLLPVLLVLGGALAIATIPIVRVLGEASGSGGGPRILFLTTLGFLPSATVLSAVPPAVIKLQLRDLAATGSTVGALSAWGTAGAIAGTFFTGYVLVAAAAVTTLIVSVGIVLVASGLVLAAAFGVDRRRELAAAVAFAGLAGAGAAVVGSPCEIQTAYYCVSIVEDSSSASGRTLVLDDLRHSYVDLDDPERLAFWYVRRLVDAIDVQSGAGAPDAAVDIVYLGGGAFTLPRYVRSTRPGSDQVIMEIDGGLVDVIEERLDFDRGDDVEILVGDGRLSMQDRPLDSADVVIGDAFGGRAVPFHLTTREFTAAVDATLRNDGIYASNVIDGPGERFVSAYAATMADVFAHVVVIRGPSPLQGRRGNSVVMASQRPIDAAALESLLAADVDPDEPPNPERVVGEVVAGDDLAELIDGVRILTDDFAPVDQLLLRSLT